MITPGRWLLALWFVSGTAQAEGLVDALVRRFAESAFEFPRAQSNAPFLPMAWVSAAGYEEGRFTFPGGASPGLSFQQTNLSQGAFLPLPVGRRDAFVIGEWLSKTRFELKDGSQNDLDLFSISVPFGWARQANADWQLAAFVAPLGHTNHDADWYWETLGGAFARYTQNDRVAWVFGAYFDVAPLEDFYTPYLGATWIINPRWTLSAILPWPAVLYSPDRDTLFRLGISPSGASWTAATGDRQPRVSLSAWNFGLGAERRVSGNIWLGLEAGVSALRGLAIVGGDWQSPQARMDSTGYALLTVNFRPSPGP